MKKTLILASTDTTFDSTIIASYAAGKTGEPVRQPVITPIYRENYDALNTGTFEYDILETIQPRNDIPAQIVIMNNNTEFFNAVKQAIDKDLNTTGKTYNGGNAVSGQMAIWTIQ